VDLNRDSTFSTNELLMSGASIGTGSLNGTITIPATALAGNTRMRVSMVYGSTASACGNFTYGEVEDYTVTIP
jgi:bacillolysin